MYHKIFTLSKDSHLNTSKDYSAYHGIIVTLKCTVMSQEVICVKLFNVISVQVEVLNNINFYFPTFYLKSTNVLKRQLQHGR